MAVIKTNQEKTLAEVVDDIKRINTQLYQSMKHIHTMGFNEVWNNKSYTGKQIVEAFGTDAVALFTISAGIQQLLKAADPTYQTMLPPSKYTVTPQEDGTVTVTEND